MMRVPVAVGADVDMLNQRRAFVGHGDDGLFIACEKLHEQYNNELEHQSQCLQNVGDGDELR
jgi:hypothetical protein